MAAINQFYSDMFKIASDKRFWLCPLGQVDSYKLWFIRTRLNADHHNNPRMLVVAGFHGEEKAGPYAILKWLKDCDREALDHYDISFIPIVNTQGFAKGTRYNSYGEVSNAGFCHPERHDKPSREGQILIHNIDMLRAAAADGFLSLHEDAGEKRYYMYSFEGTPAPGEFTQGLLNTLGKHFKTYIDGESIWLDTSLKKDRGPFVTNGIVYRHCDGSFEDWMFHLGVPRVAVTETPGQYQLRRRITAGADVIDTFIQLNLDAYDRTKPKK